MPAPAAEAVDGTGTRRRFLPGRRVAALLLLAVLAGGGWLAARFLQDPAPGEIPVFRAEDGEFRVAPADPMVEGVPYTGMLVLENSPPETGSEDLEVLMPPPEEPLLPGTGQELPVPTDAGDTGDDVIDVEQSDVAGTVVDTGRIPVFTAEDVDRLVDENLGTSEATGTLPLPGDKPVPPGPAPVAALGETGSAAPDEAAANNLSFDDVAAALNLAGDEDAPAGTTEAAGDAPEGVVEALEVSGVSDGRSWRVQIASHRSRDAAQESWARLYQEHHDLFQGMEAVILETALSDQTVYRLQVGEFTDRTRAEALCSNLGKREVECLPVGF